ncbi:MAG TPA: ribonucleotide-diphosphate reductase subunit beta, partial [Gammaproteobacteria bacterium]|nr:ribonucleotide-diphosphate reductase subunit beta [Gammaproteobacteria bacterium]
RELGAREVWLYDSGAALGLAETIAARNGIEGLHFVQAHSLEVVDPPQVDVAVAEVLGNFAYEEGVIETLRDAWRFVAPGGTLIPHSLVQWAAPVVSDRFDRELGSWRSAGCGLDLGDAERMTRNNMYVFAIEPADLSAGVPPLAWDSATFTPDVESRRAGRVAFRTAAETLYGFAVWWDCTLVPGVVLSTSPYSQRTHWDQIYLPLLAPLETLAGDEISLEIASETGGDEAGIAVRWTVQHRRGGALLSRQELDIGAGLLE